MLARNDVVALETETSRGTQGRAGVGRRKPRRWESFWVKEGQDGARGWRRRSQTRVPFRVVEPQEQLPGPPGKSAPPVFHACGVPGKCVCTRRPSDAAGSPLKAETTLEEQRTGDASSLGSWAERFPEPVWA